jgi:hypothetical protein
MRKLLFTVQAGVSESGGAATSPRHSIGTQGGEAVVISITGATLN